MKRKAIALLSGGLDSILAVKMMLALDIEVEALHFTSPFYAYTDKNSDCRSEVIGIASKYNIPIKIMNERLEYIEMIRNPVHGYGKGFNPCIDCRIYLLKKAKEYMIETGADFVFTGEVLGQRPMSQRRDTMRVIEKESGLEGLLLRPLSARHFEPTIPEKQGWVDRDKLLAIEGRSRSVQMQMAEDLEVKDYPPPAGGCLLTELSYIPKIRDVFDHAEELHLRDFRLLKTGRHFRLAPESKAIMGRNEGDNNQLELLRQPEEAALTWLDGNTPVAIIIGRQNNDIFKLSAKILLRYTKAEIGAECRIELRVNKLQRIFSVINDMGAEAVEKYLVA
jgi:tRNA U34 2-thiouridine synthase MnmA/TrmU